MANRNKMNMNTRVDSEVSLYLRGQLEATRASEAMKVAFRGNMHMDSRVIEVAGFKSEAFFIAQLLVSL